MNSKQFTESTTSGAIASVSTPVGKTQTRGKGVYPNEKGGNLLTGKKTNKKHPNSVSEAKLDEEDIIIVPGQGNRIKPGFIPRDKDRTDHEVEMAKSDLFQANKNAKKIYELIKDIPESVGLEGWVQEKIIKANDYLNTVREYLEHKQVSEMTGGVIAGGGVGEGMAEGSMPYPHGKPEVGDKIVWYHSNHYPKIEGTVVGWKDGHLVVKSIDPSPRNTEKTIATYRVPTNNILSIAKKGVAEDVTPASTSKVLRLIQRHRPEWFDTYGIGEVEDTVVDLADMGQFSGMSAVDALELVGQELDSLYGQQGVAEGLNDKPEVGDKIVWYHSNHYPKLEGEVVGWKGGHLVVKSIDPSPRNTEKTVVTYRVPKNNIMSVEKQGVAEEVVNNSAIIYDNGHVKIDGKMYKAKRMDHESGAGIAIQTPNKMYFSPIKNEYEMPSVTIHRALRLGGLKPTFNEDLAEDIKEGEESDFRKLQIAWYQAMPIIMKKSGIDYIPSSTLKSGEMYPILGRIPVPDSTSREYFSVSVLPKNNSAKVYISLDVNSSNSIYHNAQPERAAKLNKFGEKIAQALGGTQHTDNITGERRNHPRVSSISAILELPKDAYSHNTSTRYDPLQRFLNQPGERARQNRVARSAYSDTFGGDASNYRKFNEQSESAKLKSETANLNKKRENNPGVVEGYRIVPSIDRERYGDRSYEGLEGPFRARNGKVYYYDPKAGMAYDPDTDIYIDYDELKMMDTEMSEGSEYQNPKIGTIKANLMNTEKPTVQIRVFKHDSIRNEDYWVSKGIKTFKTIALAQAYVDRINKQNVDEGIVGKVLGGAALLAALWGIGQNQAQQVYSNSPQLQTLIKYHQMATQQGDQAKIQELERRIEDHKTRLSLGKGEVMGPDDKPIVPSFESSIMKGIQNEQYGYKRDFKRREMEHELGHETNNYAVVIDGRQWKVFADKRQAENIARSLKNKGKNASVRPTSASVSESKIPDKCPECGGKLVAESELNEEGNKDACYHKVKSRYKVWPSAYASGALVKCRKVGASNWGNKSK